MDTNIAAATVVAAGKDPLSLCSSTAKDCTSLTSIVVDFPYLDTYLDTDDRAEN